MVVRGSESRRKPSLSNFFVIADWGQYLGDIPELIMGAILLDSDYDLPLVRSIFEAHFLPWFESYCVGLHTGVVHPKAALLQLLFQRGCKQYAFEKGAFSESVKGQYEARSE
jgi:hypothetical protein